jgi:phosphoribosylformylglycinamidine synthase
MIYLIGRSRNDISSSEYLYNYLRIKESPAPYFDLDEEYEVQQLVKKLIAVNLVQSAHDVSDGGLFISLLESAMPGNFGFDITSDAEIRSDAFLFGESQSRVVVSVAPSREVAFIDFASEHNIPISTLGHVTKSEIRVDDISFGFISDLKNLYDTALEKIME